MHLQFDKVLTTTLVFVCVYIKWSIYSGDFLITNLVILWHWQEHTQTCGEKVFRVFDRVIVQLTIDQSNLQHLKLQTKLVEPKVCLIPTSSCLLISIHYNPKWELCKSVLKWGVLYVFWCTYTCVGNWRRFCFGRLRVLVFLPPHLQRPVMNHHWRRKRKPEKLYV